MVERQNGENQFQIRCILPYLALVTSILPVTGNYKNLENYSITLGKPYFVLFQFYELLKVIQI